ncbi:MAG: universal stress protein [Psychroserpens sp.]|uniref:universal stress protein n=1 Tax=Psychroserpens sp. TaxID=2020870 RepID=UPI00300199CD
MKNNTYKILVLSDMKDTTVNAIISGVSLAKMIDGDLRFFHVKKPTEVVEKESQLSAIRTINRAYLETGSDIQNLIEPVSKDYDIPIGFSHAFGNVKSEIADYIQSYKPDVIILGKRKSKPLSFIGDNVTDFVIKNYDGAIVIASEENALEPNKELSLGILNSLNMSFSTELTKSIFSHSQKPLKAFKVINGQKEIVNQSAVNREEIVEYVFEQNANTMTTLSKYILKNNIDLLCVDRAKVTTKDTHDLIEIPLKEIVSKLNVSLLVSGS